MIYKLTRCCLVTRVNQIEKSLIFVIIIIVVIVIIIAIYLNSIIYIHIFQAKLD